MFGRSRILSLKNKIQLIENIDRRELMGNLDEHLRLISEATGVEIFERDDQFTLKAGKELNLLEEDFQNQKIQVAGEILEEMMETLIRGENLNSQKVSYIISLKEDGLSYNEGQLGKEVICFTHKGKPLKPKTLGQKSYVDTIRKKDIVFGIGPAGTGKTYIAVAMAINAFKNKEVQKIVLARPAVEAGERLGFLPGDLQEKVDPYLRPLYDALFDVLGRDAAARLKEKEAIEVVPLAYMRGRTLDNSFIILDEAQNTTKEQMKMFLTRMGFGSKVVITGDITQVDLPKGKKSGLIEAEKILKNVRDIGFCYLNDKDVVRHELVKKIINAYDHYYRKHPEEIGE